MSADQSARLVVNVEFCETFLMLIFLAVVIGFGAIAWVLSVWCQAWLIERDVRRMERKNREARSDSDLNLE